VEAAPAFRHPHEVVHLSLTAIDETHPHTIRLTIV
jgi:hypothetical protein